MKTDILAEPILVGRAQQLEELQLSLDAIMEGKGTTIFVSGEAGSGKTRIANEFLNLARDRGVTVLSGWCLSNVAVPYFPFVEAFDSYLSINEGQSKPLGSQHLGAKAWLMGADTTQAISPQAWKDQTFASVAKELLFISTGNPIILFIDDLHWADSASLSLLHYISRFISSERILILATFRSEEVNVNVEGHGHQLAETLRLMGREGLFNEIRLSGLSQADVGGIAESMLGGKVQVRLIEKLAVESHGIPLFVVESLRMLAEHKSLIQEKGEWCSSIEELGIPSKVKNVIMRRINSLNPTQRRILDAASVIGEKFDPNLVSAAISADILAVLDALNATEESTRLVHCEENCYQFDHAKTREMLYDEMPSILRNVYHLRVAEKIESASQNSKKVSVSDIAYHYTKAKNKEKSIEYSLLAGKDALAQFSNAEAIKFYSYVIDTASDASECAIEKSTALEGLGDALSASGLFEEAIKGFEKVSEIAKSDAERLRALRKAVVCCYWRGDSAHSLELAAKAEEYKMADRLEYARLCLYKGFVAGRSHGKTREALEEMNASLKVFEEEYSLSDVARALVEMSFLYPMEDQLEEALDAALRSVVLYEEIGDLRELGFAVGRLGTAFGNCGFFQEALDSYSKAIKLDDKVGDYNSEAFQFMMSGLHLEYLGDFSQAVVQSLKGLELAERTDAHYIQSLCYANLVREYARLGQAVLAVAVGKKLDNLFNEKAVLKSNKNAVFTAFSAKAFLYCLSGQWKESNEIFKKKRVRISTYESFWKETYAWVLEKQGRAAEAKSQLEDARRINQKLAGRFEHFNVKVSFMAPNNVEVGQTFDTRFDIVNISKGRGMLVSIENILLLGFKIVLFPQEYAIQKDSLNLKEKVLTPFQVASVKLKLQSIKAGTFKVIPQVIYVDSTDKKRAFTVKPISIIAKLKALDVETPTESAKSNQISNEPVELEKPLAQTSDGYEDKFEFATEVARKTFAYLVDAFSEDYMRRRIVAEKAGWRTRMEIVKDAKIPVRSVYGEGHRRLALAELERRGLVEVRIFPGERGRGGRILKVRVLYDKEPIKRHIDRRITKGT